MSIFYEKYWKKKKTTKDLEIKWPSVKSAIPLKKNLKFLDFGCGRGDLTERIMKINPSMKLTGVDVSKIALQQASKRFPKGKFFIVEDGEKLPFNDDSFDFIVATDVLEHVYNTKHTFKELYRVLKQNGTFFISVPYHGMIKNIIATLIAFDEYFKPTQEHIRFYTKKNLKSSLKTTGFQIKKFGFYGRIYPLSNAMFAICTK